jgi:hypothetical protein
VLHYLLSFPTFTVFLILIAYQVVIKVVVENEKEPNVERKGRLHTS